MKVHSMFTEVFEHFPEKFSCPPPPPPPTYISMTHVLVTAQSLWTTGVKHSLHQVTLLISFEIKPRIKVPEI